MKCGAESVGESRPHMRLSVWQNMQNGYKSRFCGQIRIELDEKTRRPKEEYLGTQWYYLKPRVSLDEPGQEMNPEDTSSSSQIGELCLRLFYTADHVLPMEIYKPLQAYLISSIDVQPFFVSPTGLLEHLPSLDLVVIARPLMKLFIQANQIRPLIRVLCSQEIAKCEDVHMLFRSQSLASKVIYEQLVFVGHQYLVISLKPIIDMIFNDRKNCEIDPAKLSADDSLDQNRVNLLVYGELAVTRLLESFRWCPLQLREMFAEVRRTVSDYYPGREDIQRLAVSSFVIMRFFAAALVSPKLFGLKREHADPMISRTLTLLSKILQRLTNHAVCGRSLSVKEPWLTSILERFISIYKGSMLRFLDKISMENCDVPVSGENALVLRDGFFDERNSKDKKRILKNILHQKRRYVVLTENEIYWQKTKLDPEPKGRIFLQDVNSIEPVVELRNVFRISTPTSDIQFQAQSAAEMNEWIVQIQKQRKRNLLSFYRISEASNVCEIDAERELEAIHMTLYEYAETLKNWKNALEGVEQSENAKLPKYLENMLKSCEDPDAVRRVFLSNLEDLLHGTLLVENTHRNVVNHFLSQIRNERGSRDAQIGDENYLLLKSRFQKSLD
ncbi:hypothetical protein AB6A40_003314 [Gnathostoma spinigerum]|uniref:Ras GTPase-activating protein n=1 Tax=Gnathostoma spinigerum TaxID=75299 RepID=A0ABD6EK18_9BILA